MDEDNVRTDILIRGKQITLAECYPTAHEFVPEILEMYVLERGWEFLPHQHFK